MSLVNNLIFVLVRFSTVVLSVLTLYYGIENSSQSNRGLIALIAICTFQVYLIFNFLTEFLKASRESSTEESKVLKKKAKAAEKDKSKKERVKESDLPEADQNTTSKKLKSK